MTLPHATCNNAGRTFSVWMQEKLLSFAALQEDLSCDVCIVGGGIVGLMCAYTLAKEGKSVVLVDQACIGGGQTARTSAHLSWALDDRFHNLETYFGKEGAQLAAESHAAAIDYIEKIVQQEHIDCDFERVDGYLFTCPEHTEEDLDKELEAVQRTGMPIYKVHNKHLSESFNLGSCLHFPRQAQFHILKYLQGLIQACLKYGVRIFSDTHVKQIEEDVVCLLSTATNCKITCQAVIVATCTPVNDRFVMHTKQSAYRTYMIGGIIPPDAFSKALYWDTGDPYHYMRVQKDTEDPHKLWLLVGGEDHKVGQGEEEIDVYFERLEQWTRKRIPQLGRLEYRWSGQVFEPIDGLAFIGKNPGNKHVYIATGDSGNGLTHAAIASMLIPDLILQRDNPWAQLYAPARKTLSAAREFMEENANTLWQYTDWLTPGEQESVEQLALDKGFILRKGTKKYAIYKDQDGKVHINSACCPHLAGCVRWNDGEKSWDCPCHGSRFDGCGQVITGPAISNLTPKTGD